VKSLAFPFKAVIFFALITLARENDFSILKSLLLIGGGIAIYYFPQTKPSYKFTGAAIIGLSLTGIILIANNTAFLIFAVLISLIMQIAVNLKNLELIYRNDWHYLVTLTILYFGILFISEISRISIISTAISSVVVFLTSLLLLSEFFSRLENDNKKTKEVILGQSAILALSTSEIFWAVNILPVKPIYSANIIIAFLFIVTEILKQSHISKKNLITNIAIFLILVIATLAVSNWQIGN